MKKLFYCMIVMLLVACNSHKDSYGVYDIKNQLQDSVVFFQERRYALDVSVGMGSVPMEVYIESHYDTIAPSEIFNIGYISEHDEDAYYFGFGDYDLKYALIINGTSYSVDKKYSCSFLHPENYEMIEPLRHIFYIDEVYVEQLVDNQIE